MSQAFVFRWEVNRWASEPAVKNEPADDDASRAVAKRQRDLFLEMKRAEDPFYSCFSGDEVREFFFSAPFGALPARSRAAYGCVTQREGTVDRVFLGRATGKVYLWESGATINWIARRDGYPSNWHARAATLAAYWAAREWNRVMDGRVTFRYVDRFDDACFKVEYGGECGDVFARTFTPEDWARSLNSLRVFRKCFEWDEVARLRNVMLHELGHVLGLRHEHAHDGVQGFLPPEDIANGPESVLWGARNPKSVMAYYRGQRIQKSDVSAVRSAYDELWDGRVIEGKGRLGLVKKVVARVNPNN